MVKQKFFFLMRPIVLVFVLSLFLGGCNFAKVYEVMAPTDQVELTREVQRLLKEKGFDPGPVDGQSGKKTNSALAAFQKSRGLPSTNGVNAEAFGQLMTIANSKPKSEKNSKPKSEKKGNVTYTYMSEMSEEEKRKELSFSEPRVKFSTTCPGLFIPQIFEKKFENIIPMYAMRVLNNSDNRYSIKYDMKYTEKNDHYYDKSSGTSTVEKDFVIRPGSFSEFLLIQVKQNNGAAWVTSIDEITVFRCEKT